MRRQWILPIGTIAVMVVLTPTVLHTSSTSWIIGWSAILVGAIAVLVLLVLAERLSPQADRATIPSPTTPSKPE